MRKLAIGLAVFAVLGTPAFAQYYDPDLGSGNLVHGPGGAPVRPGDPAYIGQRGGAYNYSYDRADRGRRCHIVIHREWHHGRRITIRERVC